MFFVEEASQTCSDILVDNQHSERYNFSILRHDLWRLLWIPEVLRWL